MTPGGYSETDSAQLFDSKGNYEIVIGHLEERDRAEDEMRHISKVRKQEGVDESWC